MEMHSTCESITSLSKDIYLATMSLNQLHLDDEQRAPELSKANVKKDPPPPPTTTALKVRKAYEAGHLLFGRPLALTAFYPTPRQKEGGHAHEDLHPDVIPNPTRRRGHCP